MEKVKYIKIGNKQYKKKNVILFFTGIIIIHIMLQVYIILKQDKVFKVTPKTKEELIYLIKEENTPLFLINTSKITDMSWLFHGGIFVNYAGIELWDVSNVENMEGMFYGAGRINADLSSWDISKVKNMQYMFAYTAHISKEKVNNWKVSDDVKYYGIFRGTKLENNPPDWFKLKNEFETKYYPESKGALIRMLKDENILAGEIDVSKVDDAAGALDNIKRYNKSYLNEYEVLLDMRKTIGLSISQLKLLGYSVYSGYSYQKERQIEHLENRSREYDEKLLNMRKKPFYEELQEPKKLIHDDYPGIEFWNVPDIDKILEKVNE